MRITICASAHRHGITDTEIRAVVEHPALRQSLTPRIPDSAPVLFVGAPAANEPDIEVIADAIGATEVVVFHATMLRPSLVATLGLDRYIEPSYGPQRH